MLTLQDKKLLELQTRGLSPAEMAEATGMTAEACHARVRQIWKDRDIWTETERNMALLYQAQESLANAMKNLDSYDPKAINAQANAIKTAATMLDRVYDRARGVAEQVTQAQAETMIRLIQRTFYAAIDELAYRNPDIPKPEIIEIFQNKLVEARGDLGGETV